MQLAAVLAAAEAEAVGIVAVGLDRSPGAHAPRGRESQEGSSPPTKVRG